jgi:hypothetical protein
MAEKQRGMCYVWNFAGTGTAAGNHSGAGGWSSQAIYVLVQAIHVLQRLAGHGAWAAWWCMVLHDAAQ